MIYKKLQLHFKWKTNDFLRKLNLLPSPKLRKGELRILCFHGICGDDEEYINGRFMHQSDFEELVLEMKRREVQFIAYSDFLENKLNQDSLNVLLTFDDGYANNYARLLPIVERHEIPIVLFPVDRTNYLCLDLFDIAVANDEDLSSIRLLLKTTELDQKKLKSRIIQSSPEFVERVEVELEKITRAYRNNFDTFYKLLSAEQKEELRDNPLVTVGYHSHSHYNLTLLTEQELQIETDPTQVLRVEGRVPFALPYGAFDEQVINSLRRTGYSTIFGTEKQGLGVVPRLTVNPFISTDNMLRIINNGKY